MRTRKVHPKTRNGCLGCKQRHVKCGEEKPTCVNCQKRNIRCSFAAITPSEDVKALLRSSASSSTSPNSDGQSANSALEPVQPAPTLPSPPSKIPIQPERPLNSLAPYFQSDGGSGGSPWAVPDRELFQFFVEKTAVSLSSYMEAVRPTWQVEIPKLALNNSLVRDTLLSMASMDLARRTDKSSPRYGMLLSSAASRLNVALPEYRVAIEDINSDNCTDLFTCSVFIALYTFADSTIEYRDLADSALTAIDTYQTAYRTQLITGMLRGLRGARSITQQSNSWLLQGPLAGLAGAAYMNWPGGLVLRSEFSRRDDSRLEALALLWVGEDAGTEDVRALDEALWLLRRCFAYVTYIQSASAHTRPFVVDESYRPSSRSYRSPYRRAPDGSAVCFWPIMFSDRFLRLVDRHNPYAMALIAHFAVILHRARAYYWWLEGISELFLTTAREVLGPSLDAWIEWPIRIILENEVEAMAVDDVEVEVMEVS